MKNLICLLIAVLALALLCACNNVQDINNHDHSHDHTHATESQGVTDSTALQNEDAEQGDTETPMTQSADPATDSSDHTHSTEGGVQGTDYPFTMEATGTLMQKHSVKIDIPFEQEYFSAKSDKEIASVCETYTEKWKTIADRYYKEILYYNGSVPTDPNFSTDEEMHKYIEQRKTQWEADFQKDTQDYLDKAITANPNNEQKAQALSAAYKFDLQREFALELIGIYELLGEFNNQEF